MPALGKTHQRAPSTAVYGCLFFTQQYFCSGKGSLSLRRPAGTRPAGRAQGGAPPCRRAERRGCLPQDGGRQPGTARRRLGERGAAPQRKGGAEKCAQILVVIAFDIFKNSYYFTIFHASPEPVNLREMGGRFRCWLSVVKKR